MNNLNNLSDRIKNKEKTLLIFDYDGTLVPIKDKPEMALMSPVLRCAIENITNLDCLKIAIVTGRSISYFRALSGLSTSKIQVFGMHGGEIEVEGQSINNICCTKIREILDSFSVKLQEKCVNLKGILIEDKKYSIAMHYRLADERAARKAVNIFNDLTKEFENNDLFKIQTGKMVLELLPTEFSKDKAIYRIIQDYPDYLPFYFGDDVTDIAGFKEVKKNGGYTVGIKPLPFASEFIVDFEITQSELENFLINSSGAYACWKSTK